MKIERHGIKGYKLFEIDSDKTLIAMPKICPLCQSVMEPVIQHTEITKAGDDTFLKLLLRCPSCYGFFLADFVLDAVLDGSSHYAYYCTEVVPNIPEERQFDDIILKISPMFVEIYNQSLASEAYKLNHLSGMGYRKALEFLIKDYAIFKNSESEDKIKQVLLSKCIQDFIDDPRIKTTATVANWLGNDETHYVKQWLDKDVGDMKKFIDACIYYILMGQLLSDADALTAKK